MFPTQPVDQFRLTSKPILQLGGHFFTVFSILIGWVITLAGKLMISVDGNCIIARDKCKCLKDSEFGYRM